MKKLSKGDAFGIAIIIALIVYAVISNSCAPSHKMVKPNGCKPRKEVKHEMAQPEPKIKRHERKNN